MDRRRRARSRRTVHRAETPLYLPRRHPVHRERIAEYKADAVKRFAATAHERPFGPPMYVESCPRQAARIEERSGVMVVCPASGEVLGPEGCWL